MVVRYIGELDWVRKLEMDEAYELWGDVKKRGFDGVPPAVVDAVDKLMDFALEHSDPKDYRTPMEIIVHELDIDHEWCEELNGESCEKAGVLGGDGI